MSVAEDARGARPVAIAFVALCGLLVSGCAPDPEPAIRFGLPTAPVTLDPRFATDAQSDRIIRLLHPPLVTFDDDAMPQPAAADWERLGPTHYRVRLRREQLCSSGRLLHADDVVATYRAVLDRATGSPHRQSLSNIRELAAIDAQTVDFRLHRADVLFPATLVIGIVPARELDRDVGAEHWRESCGAFVLEARNDDGGIVLRRRHDDMLVRFIPVRDVTVRALKLIGGELDIAQGSLAPEIFAWLGAQPGLRAERRAGSTFSYLGFNLADGPTADVHVRRAIAHAIDREAIIRHLFGAAARVADGVFPPEHWAGAADLEAPAYDPERARQLLAAAGYAERRLTLTYKTSSDYFRLRIATVLQQQLAAIGIDLNIQSLDWGTFYGDVRQGRFEMYGLSWVGLRLPDIFRYAFHSESFAPAGANRGRYVSAAADALIERAERLADPAEQARVYRALAQRLLYDLPYVPLWFEDQLLVTRADISGYHTNAAGHYDALAGTVREKRP